MTEGATAGQDGILTLFEGFRGELEASNGVREEIKLVTQNMDAETRKMQAALMAIHSGTDQAVASAVTKLREHVEPLRTLNAQLAAIMKSHPGQYYRYHDIWRHVHTSCVFLVAFVHWLKYGTLLTHSQVESELQLRHEEFGIDLEDYLVGVCSVSNEMPRYVVNRVTAGDYDCPAKVASFLSDLYAAFRLLNLRNDFLRKRFDGLKYDLKPVEEVLYDVKILGLQNRSQPG